MKDKPICKNCRYCKHIGNSKGQRSRRIGRAHYECIHPKVYEMKDKHGFPINNFIGYGDYHKDNSLELKGCKSFCPMKDKKVII